MNRWILDGHMVEDKVTGKFYKTRDQFIVDAFNIIYTEIQSNEELKKENKKLKEKLDDILELTELTGMIHLRKAEIKRIINR